MQYLGGKSRIAKSIAGIIKPTGYWWDPFCGGLSVARELSKFHPIGMVSDISEPLISLYQSYQKGWRPPRIATEVDHSRAKMLPDSDPLKGFFGFGCSFGGIYFGSFSGNRFVRSKSHPYGMKQDPVGATCQALERDLLCLKSCLITRVSFMDINPVPSAFEVIYCDPPYQGTTGYKKTPTLDYDRFWQLCLDWSRLGTRVFVSELSNPPISHRLVWSRCYEKRVGSGGGQINNDKVEKLFQIGV